MEQNQEVEKTETTRGGFRGRGPRGNRGRGAPRGGGRGRNNGPPVSRETAVAASVSLNPRDQRTPVTDNPFKPKNLGGTPTPFKNDVFTDFEVVMQGFDMLPNRATREFKIDMSGYYTLIDGSYQALIQFDRAIYKYISRSMYYYYCTIALWRRLWFVTSTTRGANLFPFQELERMLPDMIFPKEIEQYLEGIGNVKDEDGVEVDLRLHTDLNQAVMNGGAQGSYGAITANTHLAYETMPAPIVPLLKLSADYDTTVNQAQPDWDMPQNLRPAGPQALGPTGNLLGWRRAEVLTQEQMRTLQSAGMNLDPGNLDFSVQNIHGLPINYQLLSSVSNYLSSSKTPNVGKFSTNSIGSVGQVAYQVGSPNDQAIDARRISDKDSFTNARIRLVSGVSLASSIFQYRYDRNRQDGLCYRFNNQPNNWIVNRNNIYTFGYAPHWNFSLYSTAVSNGVNNASTLSRIFRNKTQTEKFKT